MANEPLLSEEQVRAMRGDLAIPDKPVFDADEPSFSPNTTNQLSSPSSVDELIAHEGGGKKKLFWILGGVGAVIILGLIGYFVVYGLATSEPTVATPQVPAQPTTPIAQPALPVLPATPAKTTAFINDADNLATAPLQSPLNHNDIIKTLSTQGTSAAAGTTELVLTTNGNPIPFSAFFAALATGFTANEKSSVLFTDDFTAFIYKDASGIWPGYVASLKPTFIPEDLRAWFTALEKTPASNFFLTLPGKMAAFKDGVVGGKYADRYATGSLPGVSLGYLMLPQQNKVLISTSFNGMKEALRLMGL